MKFQFGDKVKDIITGFAGIIVARTEWLNGCVRYALQEQKVTKDGKPAESQWVDEEQCALVKAAAVKLPKLVPHGGPKPTPTRAADPR